MGYFSWNCQSCGLSLRESSKDENLTKGVAIFEDGSILKGEYDGYGRLHGPYEAELDGTFSLFHQACWEKKGCPTEFVGQAPSAADQGFGTDEPNDPDRTTKEELEEELRDLKEELEETETGGDYLEVQIDHLEKLLASF